MANNSIGGRLAALGGVSVLALSAGVAAAETADSTIQTLQAGGAYLSGDYHNHTTCTDGSMSVTTTVNESLVTYGLDWFAQTGHGGGGIRDCRFDDPEYDAQFSGDGEVWEETLGHDEIGGVEATDSGYRVMWRWQNLIEYSFPMQRDAGRLADKPAWIGVETNAPGHEHVSMAILDGQFDGPFGDAYATGQFEYLFDRSDRDTSGGAFSEGSRAGFSYDFENPRKGGVTKQGDVTEGTAGHGRAVESVAWMRKHFGKEGYYVPAHVERQGGFVEDDHRGYNVEHFRDFHNAGLLNPHDPTGESIAFGAEMIAGHQLYSRNRGSYHMGRPTAGFGTYGGAGAYGAAEISVPGHTFDGEALTDAHLAEIKAGFDAELADRLTFQGSTSDFYRSLNTGAEKMRYVLGQPGVRTMWDALLGEGRRFFIFGSSDWHSRGNFGPFEPQSTSDAWPGEYQKIYAYTEGHDRSFSGRVSQRIVDGMRVGNSYSVMGDLVDEFYFVMCQDGKCATMGEELKVDPKGGDVTWTIKLRDPSGVNHAPYTFANPSLAQIGVDVPVNEPKLSHIDLIRGDITGIIEPSDEAYTTNVSNPSTEIFASVDNYEGEFQTEGEYLVATGVIDAETVTNDMYFRVRGTNMRKGTPHETDANGNPLLDDYSALVECTPVNPTPDENFHPEFCPEHLPVDAEGNKYLDADVESWVDLWLYANPVFVKVEEKHGGHHGGGHWGGKPWWKKHRW